MKVYMAGPLFTTAERDFNARLARGLRERGHEVWLPQESEQKPPVTANGIFTKDVAGLDWAEVILGNMDGPDPDSGTCFECGAVYRRKPTILYRTDIRDVNDGFPPFNLMLTQSAFAVLDLKWATAAAIEEAIHTKLVELALVTVGRVV